jgi:hypothetical protein
MDYDDTKQDKTTTNQQDHTYSKLKDAANMMANVDKSKLNVDTTDSMDEKIDDSANNSMDSSEYFPSAEPSESSQDAAGAMETEDSIPTFSADSFRHHASSQLPQTIELSAEESDSGGKPPKATDSYDKDPLSEPKLSVEESDSGGKPPKATDSYDRDPLSKQKSLGFVPSNLNVMKASEDLKNSTEVIEIFSSPEPVDPNVRPKFILPSDQPTVVSEDPVTGKPCSVQNEEDGDSVVTSREKITGDRMDTKTLGVVLKGDGQRDTDKEKSTLKSSEDKSMKSSEDKSMKSSEDKSMKSSEDKSMSDLQTRDRKEETHSIIHTEGKSPTATEGMCKQCS